MHRYTHILYIHTHTHTHTHIIHKCIYEKISQEKSARCHYKRAGLYQIMNTKSVTLSFLRYVQSSSVWWLCTSHETWSNRVTVHNFIYKYLCIYIYIYICVCVCVCVCVYETWMKVNNAYIYIYIYMCVCVNVCKCIYIYIYIYIYIWDVNES